VTTATTPLAAIAPVSNGAKAVIEAGQPYVGTIGIEGSAAFLFHRWLCEAVEAKSAAAKGSRAKKSDDLESYVYRDPKGILAIPGEYFRMSLVNAAKFRQDPRSPRKSAYDLFKAAVAVQDEHCSLGVKSWDYVDQRRVTVQRNGITRMRPAMQAGWKATLTLMILLPEYVPPAVLYETLSQAGRLIGVGDFRPTYGRFFITSFEVR
jgi:hypothetical protein